MARRYPLQHRNLWAGGLVGMVAKLGQAGNVGFHHDEPLWDKPLWERQAPP